MKHLENSLIFAKLINDQPYFEDHFQAINNQH